MSEGRSKYLVELPQEVFEKLPALFEELLRVLKTSRRNTRLTIGKAFIGLAFPLFFFYMIFFGGGGMSRSPYKLVPVRVHSVEVPSASLYPVGVSRDSAVAGTFIFASLKGVINEAGSGGARIMPFDDMLNHLAIASRQKNIKAVILDVNSGGGTVSGSERLRAEVRRLKERGIKVVALYDGISASGAIFASIDADYIIASRSSLVGSIGVIFSWFNVSGFMSRYGLKLEVIKSGPMKDMGSYARDPTPQERARLQGLIQETFDRFVDIVAEGRKLSRAEVLAIADGSVFSAARALEYKLIDAVSDDPKRDAVRKAMELTGVTHPTLLRPLRAPQGFFESLGVRMQELRADNVSNELIDALASAPALRYEWMPFTVFRSR